MSFVNIWIRIRRNNQRSGRTIENIMHSMTRYVKIICRLQKDSRIQSVVVMIVDEHIDPQRREKNYFQDLKEAWRWMPGSQRLWQKYSVSGQGIQDYCEKQSLRDCGYRRRVAGLICTTVLYTEYPEANIRQSQRTLRFWTAGKQDTA